jgi:F-type H+-transporting ATPase subunit a
MGELKKKFLPLHRKLKRNPQVNRLRTISSQCFIAFMAIALLFCSVGNAQHGEAPAHATASTHAVDSGSASHDPAADGKFDPVPIIMHHVSDANEYNLFADITIPLPIIIYNKTTGQWFTASSANFHAHHGEGTVEVDGYAMSHSRVHPGDHTQSYIDFSVTKNVFVMLMGLLILTFVFISLSKRYKAAHGQAPKGLQAFLEPIFQFIIEDIAKQNIGKNYQKFSVYLICVFFFILISNLLGLIPFLGSANVSGNTSFTLVLALITFLMINLFAKKDYWIHTFAMPGVPKGLLLILTPLEIMGLFIKPLALLLRLFGNITGGHIAMLSIASMIFIMGEVGKNLVGTSIGAVVALPLLIFVNGLEAFVALMQAYVFTLLSAIFIGIAQEEHHH